jgi:3-oxoacyl-[acyl-carrier protein] reductase
MPARLARRVTRQCAGEPTEHGGDMDLGLAQRTALVCASTSGLGLATARALSEEGVRVVVTSRSSERAEEVAAALPNAIGVGCDLVAADGAARLFDESTKRLGKIDILVLNGPGPAPSAAADVDDSGVDSAVAGLVKPHVHLVQSVLPGMRAQRWGRILSISSTSVAAPIANLALSNLGRAALAGYLKTLSREVAAQGITVNSLLPGRIATPRARQITEAAAARLGIPPADVEKSSIGEIPAGRYGEPDEFGAVAAFLCSAGASYVTGTALRCDGGLVPTL